MSSVLVCRGLALFFCVVTFFYFKHIYLGLIESILCIKLWHYEGFLPFFNPQLRHSRFLSVYIIQSGFQETFHVSVSLTLSCFRCRFPQN